MATEIERKFLVKDLSFKKLSTGILLRQSYLSTGSKSTVRVRIIGDNGYLTIKGPTIGGVSRSEYEYEIPSKDADKMLKDLCVKPIIEKYRYTLVHEGFVWEIDEFLQDNEGLIVAEVELENENQIFSKPDFIGDEVTFDNRYRNSSLVFKPYKLWKN